jgi:glycosyltransferase involved in cell wall biosynthesis
MQVVLIDTLLTQPPFGGSHTFLVGLAAELKRDGCSVTVVTQVGRDDSLCHSLAESRVRIVSNLWSSRHLPEERATRLARWTGEQRPDVYVISNCTDTGWLALPLLNSEVRTVAIAHNDVSAYYAPLKHYCCLLDSAVGVSSEIHRKLTSDGSIPASRTRQIPYGVKSLSEVDLRLAFAEGPVSPALRIGYVGRIVRIQKRIFDIIPIAQILASRGIAFQIDVVGDGPDRPQLETEVLARGLSAYFRFKGWLTGSKLQAAYRELDAYLLMSEYEGLPVALLEAMGNGLVPVVSATASGNAELVQHGQNGFVVTIGDASGFANQLAELARKPELLSALGYSAWKTSQHYSVRKMMSSYEDLFRELCTMEDRHYRPLEPKLTPPMPSCRSRYPMWLRKTKAVVHALMTGNAPR